MTDLEMEEALAEGLTIVIVLIIATGGLLYWWIV